MIVLIFSQSFFTDSYNDMPFSDVLEHFFQRYGYHIKEFPFIQMLMGMHQILGQIQVNQLIAESRCSIYIS